MSSNSKKEYINQMLFSIAVLLFFGVLFFVGTFFDEELAKFLYSPDNTAAAVITSTGVVPYFFSAVLSLGVLYERAIHSSQGKPVKVILCALCVMTALFVGFIGGGAIADRNCFGMLFPSIDRNILVITVLSVVFEYPLFFVGYHFAKRSDDKLLAQRMIGLLAMLAVAFITMQVLKYTFNRPRYRTVFQEYDGIGFVPWYTRFEGAAEYAELYGINGDEFLSFPSGHSILSMSAMYILPCMSQIFPKLKNKQLLMSLTGFLFGCIIMLTRMILGAHYLSDVSMGAMIGSALSLIYALIQLCISARDKKNSAAP